MAELPHTPVPGLGEGQRHRVKAISRDRDYLAPLLPTSPPELQWPVCIGWEGFQE